MSDIAGLLLLATTVGGFIRGYSGFGGPMVILPVLNLFYPPALSIWIMALVDLAPNAYLIPFEVASVLLLAALIGAIVIAREKN